MRFRESEFARFVLGSFLSTCCSELGPPARRKLNGFEVPACLWPLFAEVTELVTVDVW